jgi:hypothetical protein
MLAPRGVRLFVSREERDRAIAVLQSFEDAPGEGIPIQR